ncbi:Gfo/Idh/MocA family protein [Alphaproteobacteria bacterium LSUCC0684]
MGKDVRVALFGCGMWGRNIARNLDELNCLEAVVDADPVAAQTFADTFGCRAMSVEDAVSSQEIDAVAIVTSAPSHHDLVTRALEAGKPVFVEKPLALCLDEAEAIARVSSETGHPVVVGHLIRYHAAFETMLDCIRAGEIGDLRHIRASRLAPGRIRDTESALYDLCPHDLALIAALTGEEIPSRVEAHAISHITPGIDDMVTAQLEFSSGITASVQANWYNPVKIHNLTVIGSTAALVFDDTKPWKAKLKRHPFAVTKDNGAITLDRGDAQPIPLEESEPLKAEMAHFLDVAKGSPPRTGLAEALYVQAIMTRMETAIRTGAAA